MVKGGDDRANNDPQTVLELRTANRVVGQKG